MGPLPSCLSSGQHFCNPLVRRAKTRPRVTLLLLLALLLGIGYFVLWRVHCGSGVGRWYWNYEMSWFAGSVKILPYGHWGPVENPPRYVPEIYHAPWMGTWTLPELTLPVHNLSWSPHPASDPELPHFVSPSAYTSPAILKLHIFSTPKETSQAKRQLIRKLSPLLNLPPEYRHLVEMKFVLGHAINDDWSPNHEMERQLEEEQRQYGDLIRLNLRNGENLREGKILDWIRAVGAGEDGGRPAWWLCKMDDDAGTVTNLPVFLDSLLALNANEPYYVGTSLNRWPAYHHHFTGMLTGFSWSLVKTLAYGIGEMSREEIEIGWDDDVLTGELMYRLPPAPICRHFSHPDKAELPEWCDPNRPPRWGWESAPPAYDPRSGLRRHDYLGRMGDPRVWWVSGDVAMHHASYKSLEGWEEQWRRAVRGSTWTPPAGLVRYAEEPHREPS